MVARIESKIKVRESTRKMEKHEMKRTARMMKKDSIAKKWMEERRMESLLVGMRCLEVGSLEGEWSEHDAMTGVEKDGYDEIDDMESMQTIDNDSMMRRKK